MPGYSFELNVIFSSTPTINTFLRVANWLLKTSSTEFPNSLSPNFLLSFLEKWFFTFTFAGKISGASFFLFGFIEYALFVTPSGPIPSTGTAPIPSSYLVAES